MLCNIQFNRNDIEFFYFIKNATKNFLFPVIDLDFIKENHFKKPNPSRVD